MERAHSRLRVFAEVVYDGEEVAGQFGDAFDDPEEEEGGEYAAGEEDGLIAVGRSGNVQVWHRYRCYSTIDYCSNFASSKM